MNEPAIEVKVITKEEFLQLSASEKRMRLAKDVLQRLTMKKFVAMRSNFVNFGVMKEWNVVEQANKVMEREEACYVCALGALLMSEVFYTNDMSVHVINLRRPVEERLYKYFSNEQIGLIEAAFERSEYDATYKGVPTKLAAEAVDFGLGYENSEDVMSAIMNNIIDNDGLFVP